MNKKFKCAFFAFVLMLMTFTVLVPKPIQAQTPAKQTAKQLFITQFNRQMTIFNAVILNSQQTMTRDRFLQLLSAALGIPIQTVRNDFVTFNLPLNEFTVILMISHEGGVPFVGVINLMQLHNFTLAEVARFLNPNRTILARMKSLIGVFDNEIGIERGTIVVDQTVMSNHLTTSFNDLLMKLNIFQSSLGDDAFTKIVFRRLALETNVDVQTLLQMRNTMIVKVTLVRFVVIVLASNTISASMEDGSIEDITNVFLNGHFGLDLLVNLFTQHNIPLNLFGARMDLFAGQF